MTARTSHPSTSSSSGVTVMWRGSIAASSSVNSTWRSTGTAAHMIGPDAGSASPSASVSRRT